MQACHNGLIQAVFSILVTWATWSRAGTTAVGVRVHAYVASLSPIVLASSYSCTWGRIRVAAAQDQQRLDAAGCQ